MTKDEEVRAYTRALGKEGAKALAFFFLGLPAIIAAFVFLAFL